MTSFSSTHYIEPVLGSYHEVGGVPSWGWECDQGTPGQDWSQKSFQ